jgi:hypothetical protein
MTDGGGVVLTVPGAAQPEVPNLALGIFPFLFIPAYVVPLVVVLHVPLMRSVTSRAIQRSR